MKTSFFASAARSGDTAVLTPGPPPDAPDVPVAGFEIADPSGQAPFAIDITNTSTGAIDSYRWDFDDGTVVDTISSTPPAHTFTGAGTFDVTLTVTNSAGSDSHIETVTVSAAPAAPVAGFTRTPTSGSTPLTVAFTDTSTGTVTSWLWNFGDGSTSLSQNPTHVYATAGVFVVTLAVTGPGGTSNTQNTVTATAPASAGTRVAFKVFNSSSAALASGIVSRASVPFSKTDGPYTTGNLSVENASGQKVPCQFVVLSRWFGLPSDTSKRIKMVQCIFQADVSAGSSADFSLNTADVATNGALTYTETSTQYVINTGAATFTISKTSAGLFHRVAIGSEEIVDRGSALDCALSSGQAVEADVVSVVEVSGTVMLRIRKTGRLGPANAARFILRQTFYSGSAAVENEFSIQNTKVPWISNPQPSVIGMLRVARSYLDVTLKNSGTLTVRDATGDVTTSAISGYKHCAWVRRQTHKTDDRTTKAHDGGVNYSFTTRHALRVTRQGATTEGATYDGGWSAKGSAGGVIVGVDRYWEMGPRSVEVDASIGRVRVGQFPDGAHDRPHAVRARDMAPFLTSNNANYRPAGYSQDQAAPVDFPDVTPPVGEAMPASPGSGTSPLGFWAWNSAASEWRLNAQPDKRVDALDSANYRIEGGSWHTIRCGMQFFGSATTPTTAQIAQFQSFVNTPPVGLCEPIRYRETDILLGQFVEKFRPQRDPDADRSWRNFEILVDNLAADPANAESGNGFPSGAKQYRGWPLTYESGGITNALEMRIPYGYNAFGDTFYGGDGWGNCHYDTGRAFAFGMIASRDTRFLAGFLDHGRWARDMGRFHVGVLNYDTSTISLAGLDSTTWKWSGCNRYEKGQWHGSSAVHPGSSHSWICAEVMLYWLLGDPLAADSLKYAARYFGYPAHNANPAYFEGTGGERTLSWAIEGLVWIDAALGPLPVCSLPNSSGGLASSTATPLEVARGGLTNYRRWMTGVHHFSGVSLPAYNRKNYVPAAHHKDFTSTDFSSQGFLIAPSSNPKYVCQPWMNCLFLQAATMLFRADPTKDFTQITWLEYAQVLYLMAHWVVEDAMTANAGSSHNVQHYWYPPRVLRVMGKLGTASPVFRDVAPVTNPPSYASFTVNGSHSVGATSIALTAPADGGGTVIAGDLVEFENHKIAGDATGLWPYRVSTTLSGLTLALSNPLAAALASGTRMRVIGGTNNNPNQVPNGSNADRAGGGNSLTGKYNTNLLLLWNAAMGLSQYVIAVQGTPYEELAEGTILPVAKYAWRQCVRFALHLGDWETGMPADPGAEPPGPYTNAGTAENPLWVTSANFPPINIDRGVVFGGIAAKFWPREFCVDSMATLAALVEVGELTP